jgi:hypothetical protein
MISTFMRKSSAVPLTLLAALAAFATGCRDTPESRSCVDAQGRIVPDSNCSTGSHGGSGGMGFLGYHYLYGGASGGRVGDQVVGGRSTPSESGVSRGGFGGEGGGEGGGE